MDNADRQAQRVTVCRDCSHMAAPCLPGLELLKHIQAAIGEAGVLSGDFGLEGSVSMTRCARTCMIIFQATVNATFVFGDMCDDIGELVSLARIHQALPAAVASDNRCADLRGGTPARWPAAILASERPRTLLQ